MKLMLIFVSALVLVAQGNAAPSKEEERVKEVPSEVVGGYAVFDAGQEGDVGPQGAYDLESSPAVYEPNVVGAGPEQQAFAGEPEAELSYAAPESLYIPIISRACTNSQCLYICRALGFHNGVCVSTTTCRCYN